MLYFRDFPKDVFLEKFRIINQETLEKMRKEFDVGILYNNLVFLLRNECRIQNSVVNKLLMIKNEIS